MAYGDAEEERQRLARQHSRQSSQLYDALRKKNYDTARWITGVPPAPPAGSDDPDETDLYDRDDLDDADFADLPELAADAERTAPPTAEEQFREHKGALLYDLDWTSVLPAELVQDWTRRVLPLDLRQPRAGLAAIEDLAIDYQLAERWEPHITEVTRGMAWIEQYPRIGREIAWLTALFQHVLASPPADPTHSV